MLGQLILPAMLICALSGATVILLTNVGAVIYDLRLARMKRQNGLHPYAQRNRDRPLVTIMIPARNSERTIIQCLDSVYKNSYKKLEIIVVDCASSDAARRVVKEHADAHPKKSIRLFVHRRTASGLRGLVASYQRHGHGQLVMVLDPAAHLINK